VLRFFEPLNVQQTATAMRCRPGTVKALTHKAMVNLKRQMGDAGDEFSPQPTELGRHERAVQ
jgi:DNA-directed RNA polymerase specialized sigma24 family protein